MIAIIAMIFSLIQSCLIIFMCRLLCSGLICLKKVGTHNQTFIGTVTE